MMVCALLSLPDSSMLHSYCESTIVFNFFSSEAVVGLEDTFYRVSEGVGFVEVCAIVYHPVFECPIDFSFDVDFSASDGSAGKDDLVGVLN